MDTWNEFDQNVVNHSAAHHLMAEDDLLQRLGYALRRVGTAHHSICHREGTADRIAVEVNHHAIPV